MIHAGVSEVGLEGAVVSTEMVSFPEGLEVAPLLGLICFAMKSCTPSESLSVGVMSAVLAIQDPTPISVLSSYIFTVFHPIHSTLNWG